MTAALLTRAEWWEEKEQVRDLRRCRMPRPCTRVEERKGRASTRSHAAFWASLRSTGVFLPWAFTVGQECFQGGKAGLGFHDMSVQLGH